MRKHFNFNEMDLFLSFSCVILLVIRDCTLKIVSTALVSRLHISRWYTMLDSYTGNAMGICSKMLNNTKFSFSCTHKERQCFVKLSAMSYQKKTVKDRPMDSRWTTFLQRPPGYQMYVINSKIDNIIKYSNYFPEMHSKIVIRTIYYHFHLDKNLSDTRKRQDSSHAEA